MNPLGLILPWWAKYAAIAALVAASFITGWVKGHESEKNQLDTFTAQTKAIADVQLAHNKQIAKERERIDDESIANTQGAVKFLSTYYSNHPHVVRLCDTANSSRVSSNAEITNSITTDSAGEGGIAQTNATGATQELPIDLQLVGSGLIKLLETDKWVKQQEDNN